MSLHDANHNVLATTMAANAFTEHVEGLSHTRGVAQEEFENRLFLMWRGFFKPLLGCLGHALVLSS